MYIAQQGEFRRMDMIWEYIALGAILIGSTLFVFLIGG